MIRKNVLLICLPLLLWACTDIVEIDLPNQEPQLVINGLFTPDSVWNVDISAGQNALSNETYKQVQDATVELYQGGKHLFNLLHNGNGKYKSEVVLPQELQHYTLKVSAPGYPTSEASNFAPSLPAIRSIKVYRTFNSLNPSMPPEAEVRFVLDDVPGMQNYYFVSAYFQDTAYTGEAFKNYSGLNFMAPIEKEFTMGSRYFFSDKLIDGKPTTLTLRYTLIKGKTVHLNISQISPDYYHYVRTLVKQSYNDNFMTTPGPVHNNIRNGLGIFAGYSTVTYRIKH